MNYGQDEEKGQDQYLSQPSVKEVYGTISTFLKPTRTPLKDDRGHESPILHLSGNKLRRIHITLL